MEHLKGMEEWKEHFRKMKEDPEYRKIEKEKIANRIKEDWLKMEPFKVVEDIPQLPVVDKEEWENFFIPILIKCGAVPKKDLKDGVWYVGDHRNCQIAKWDAEKNKFHHIRYKFGHMLDDCNHFEDDDGYALFVPIREANENEIKEQEDILKNL